MRRSYQWWLWIACAAALAPADAGIPESAPVRLLVRYRAAPGEPQRRLVEDHAGRTVHEFPEFGVLAVEIPQDRLAGFLRQPEIRSAEPDPVRWALSTLPTAELKPSLQNGLYGLVTTRTVTAQGRGALGAGAAVCVADTGIDAHHPDIEPNYRGGVDEVDHDEDPDVGSVAGVVHGTHVAATIIAALNGQGVRGVAPGASLYFARVLGNQGTGNVSDILAGITHLVDVRGCRIVSLSLGGTQAATFEEEFFTRLAERGVLVVAAAGNEGAQQLDYPAAYPSVLAVGAVDVRNRRASFSNTGEGLALVAPGVSILSAVPRGLGRETGVRSGGDFAATSLQFAGLTAGLTAKLVACGTGNSALDFPPEVTGNIALIKRGDAFFSVKLENAMMAGAAAAIIYNNVPGDFSGTLQTPRDPAGRAWIPGVSVSDRNGILLLRRVGRAVTLTNAASDWDTLSGTSMAAPHVAGVAALLLGAHPSLTRSELVDFLEHTAIDLGRRRRDPIFGWGLVNADGALRAAGR